MVNKAKGLSLAINPLSYVGVEPLTPPQFIARSFDPGPTDWRNFDLGALWLNTGSLDVWFLASLSNNQATWILLGGGGGVVVETLTGNTGGAVPPTANNINLDTANTTVQVAGNPGTSTLTIDFGLSNLLLGSDGAITSGTLNTAFGDLGLNVISSGSNNAALGASAGLILTTGSNNTLLGHAAGSSFNTGSNNIIIGNLAGNNYTSTESSNIIIGNTGTLADANAIRIGTNGSGAGQQNKCFIAGIDGVNVGSVARVVTEASNQLGTAVITAGSGITITPGANTITIAMTGSGSGAIETITGNTGGAENPDGSGNFNLLTANTTVKFAGTANTESLDFGLSNLVLGSSLPSLAGGLSNVGIGLLNLSTITSGNQNTALGNGSMRSITTGSSNVAVGHSVMVSFTTGSNNIAMGSGALSTLTTGSNNVVIGESSGSAYTTSETNNIILGYNIAGTVGESNVLRVGNSSITKTFITGIRGITTVNADAVAVLIDSAGQLGTVSSSIRYKQNIKKLEHSRILELQVQSFNYKQDNRPAVGLIAEEVEKIMPELVAYNQEGQPEAVKYHDLPVFLLLEIQKLKKEIALIKQ